MNLMVVVSFRRSGVTDKPRAAVRPDRLFFPKKFLLKCFTLVLALSTAPEAMAVNRYFDCSSGSLLTASCWSGNVVPGSADTASIGDMSYAGSVTASLTSGTFTVNSESIGSTGYNGTVNHSGGTNKANSYLTLGGSAGVTGTYNLSGTGQLSAGTGSIIGSNGTGIFTQNGGSYTAGTTLSLGNASTGNGSYFLNDGSLYARWQRIGVSGTGVLTQGGGTNSVENLDLGGNSGSNGSYNLNGGSLLPWHVVVGSGGIGTFNHTGGTNSINLSLGGGLSLGQYASSSGVYNLSGTGDLTVKDEWIGTNGVGLFNQSGGTHTATGTMTLAVNAGSSGTYNLTGGTLTVNNGITNNVNGVFNAGAGTTATVGGPGFINHGILKGAGTIAGNVTSDGTVGPGNSPGALSITGNYTQSAAGIFAVEIGGLLAGAEYDVLNVSGTATLDGTLNVSLFDLGSGLFAPQAGDTFDILTADILSGSFSSLSYAALFDPNLSWQIDYLIDAIGTTDVVRLSVVASAVPVPGAVWLFGSGLLGLMGLARRKKK